jgi:putative transposase
MLSNTLFIEGGTYHVYNRGNGDDPIFRNHANYEYFLKKYFLYMSMHWETHAWCLMPNHFHFIVTVKPPLMGEEYTQCSQAFANLCNGYAQSFNRQHKRMGSLFMRSFRRKNVTDRDYLKTLTCYVHNNPVKPGMVRYPDQWEYSSYNQLYNADASKYETHSLLKLFGSKGEFHREHIVHNSPGSIEIPYAA